MRAIKILAILLFIGYNSYSQVGVFKSKDGFLAVANSGNLYFSLQIYDYLYSTDDKILNWESDNYLSILETWINLTFSQSKSVENQYSKLSPLKAYQKWEEEYIITTMPKSVKRSEFKTDNKIVKQEGMTTNSWYYYVEVDTKEKESYNLFFYMTDIYRDGNYIRIYFMGRLDNARSFMQSTLSNFHFYNEKIDLVKLKSALKNGEYYY